MVFVNPQETPHFLAPVLSLLPRGTRYPKEIGRAFRKASLKLHPDKLVACGVEETSAAEEAFAAVREAYDTLSDPVARDRYDKRASRVCPCFFGDLFCFVIYIECWKFVGFMVQRIHNAIKSGPFYVQLDFMWRF